MSSQIPRGVIALIADSPLTYVDCGARAHPSCGYASHWRTAVLIEVFHLSSPMARWLGKGGGALRDAYDTAVTQRTCAWRD